jgi:hypothetical protein
VGLGAAAEVVAAHDAGEAAAFRGADDVDQLAGGEDAGIDARSELEPVESVGWDLTHVRQAGAIGQLGCLHLALLGLVGATLFAETELDGDVAVPLDGLQLGDEAWPRLDQGRGGDHAVFVEEPGHAQLST